jgi:hypothetical protein
MNKHVPEQTIRITYLPHGTQGQLGRRMTVATSAAQHVATSKCDSTEIMKKKGEIGERHGGR